MKENWKNYELAQKVRAMLYALTRAFAKLWFCVLSRAWIIEIGGVVFTVIVFIGIWKISDVQLSYSEDMTKQVWSILPLLAITNAIPMLAVSAFLARYNSAEKPSEIMKKIYELISVDSNRLEGHPRDNPFDRSHYYASVLKRAKIEKFTFIGNNDQLYTPRPYWDGVWYYGDGEYLDYYDRQSVITYSAHELVYCAYYTLRIVRELRQSGFALVGGRRGGTQGSRWFLKKLDALSALSSKSIPDMKVEDANKLVILCADSAHYMLEEYRAHRASAIRDERTETNFIHMFCDYLVWLGYFHEKLVKCRTAYALKGPDDGRIKIVEKWYGSYAGNIGKINGEIRVIRSENLPRKFVAERMHQIRIGAILPVLMTSLVIVMYLFGQPYLYSQSYKGITPILSTILYVSSSCVIVVNFIFALFLLIPKKMRHEDDIIH